MAGSQEFVLPYTAAFPIPEDSDTVPKRFFKFASECSDRPFVSSRGYSDDGRFGDYESKTYAEVMEEVRNLCAGLKGTVKPGERVGIMLPTRYAWLLADLAVQSAGAVVVPLYTTLTDSDLQYISKTSELVAVFVAPNSLNRLLSVLSGSS